jgi:hypothetical protein
VIKCAVNHATTQLTKTAKKPHMVTLLATLETRSVTISATTQNTTHAWMPVTVTKSNVMLVTLFATDSATTQPTTHASSVMPVLKSTATLVTRSVVTLATTNNTIHA